MFPTVIRTRTEFERVRDTIGQKESYAVPIWTDTKAHLAVNTLSVLLIYLDKQWIIYSINHNEAPKMPIEWLQECTPYNMHTPFKKDLQYLIQLGKITDCAEGVYNANPDFSIPEYPSAVQEMQHRYSSISNITKAVPMMKLVEWADAMHIAFPPCSGGFLTNVAIPVYQFIESAGLQVDPAKFEHYYGKKSIKDIVNGKVYSSYYPYHITGRPSNSFGGVNFAAIQKGNHRETFISRFTEGSLIMMDFESFHLRLLAHMIGFPQPSEPFHQYLAKQYYGKQEITEEEYKTGKQLTFEYIYGSTPKPNLPFFKELDEWIKTFYQKVIADGKIHTPSGRDIPLSCIEEPTVSKVFNYMMQSEEMYQTMVVLDALRRVFLDKKLKSKLILYTYDAVLIDYCPDDDEIHQFILLVKGILEGRGFPVRTYMGPDYHNLKLIP